MLIKIEFDMIKNTVKTHKQVKYYYNLKELFSIWIYFKMFFSCDGKAELFQALV